MRGENILKNKIETMLELPYRLIDISTGNEHFVFEFKEFDKNQSDYSIMSGITGKFGIIYQCRGIESSFDCEITVGNVRDFYISLENAYNVSLGKNTVSVLKNYGEILNRSNLMIKFDHKGHCVFEGDFKNQYNCFKCGINFTFELDQSYIPKILNSFHTFFSELIRIQGHDTFY